MVRETSPTPSQSRRQKRAASWSPSLPGSKSSCARWGSRRRRLRFRRRALRCRPRPNQGRRGRVRARNTRPARHPFLAEPGCPDGFGSDSGLACLDKGPGPICRLVRRPEQRYPTCPSTLASFDSGLTHHPRFNGSGRFGDWASGIPHFLPSSDEEGGAPFSAGWLTGRQFIHAPPGPLIPRHVNRPKRYHRRDQPERTDSRGYPIRLNRASRLRWNRSPQSSKNPILACDSSAVIGNFRLHD